MAVNVATLTAKLDADIRDFDRDMKKADRRLDDIDRSTKKASKGLGGMKTAMLAVASSVAIAGLTRAAKQMTMLAVDAEEAGSAFKTVFGPAVHSAQKFVDEFANSAGFAGYELQQLMATTGNIVQGIGATEEESAKLAESMARLAGDVASFSNAAGGAPAVLKALQSGLTGETEALKTYGIVINQADIAQRALLDTGKESADQLTRLEKANATLAIAYERSGKAVGDLERTQEGAANSMRELAGMWKEAQADIGTKLIPALEALIPWLRDAIPQAVDATLTAFDKLSDMILAPKLIGTQFDEIMGNVEQGSTHLLKVIRSMEQNRTLTAPKKLAAGIITLGLETEVTATRLATLTNAAKATDDEFADGIRLALGQAEAWGLSAETVAVLEAALLDLNREQWKTEEAARNVARGMEELGYRAGTAADAMADTGNADRFAAALGRIREAAAGAAGKLHEVWLESLAATSPTFRAVKEFESLQALIKETPGGESLAITEQTTSMLGAVGALGGTLEEQAYKISSATGIALDTVIEQLEEAGLGTAMGTAAYAAEDFAMRLGSIILPGLPNFAPAAFADIPTVQLDRRRPDRGNVVEGVDPGVNIQVTVDGTSPGAAEDFSRRVYDIISERQDRYAR